MVVAPFPIIVPLALVGSIPINPIMVVLLVHALGLPFVVVPLVVVFVLFVVVAMFVRMVATIVVPIVALCQKAIWQKKRRSNEKSRKCLFHFVILISSKLCKLDRESASCVSRRELQTRSGTRSTYRSCLTGRLIQGPNSVCCACSPLSRSGTVIRYFCCSLF